MSHEIGHSLEGFQRMTGVILIVPPGAPNPSVQTSAVVRGS